MKKLLLLLLLISPNVLASSAIVTADGDSLAGLTRDRRIASFVKGDAFQILVGLDSASSTAHKVALLYSATYERNAYTAMVPGAPLWVGYTSAQTRRSFTPMRYDVGDRGKAFMMAHSTTTNQIRTRMTLLHAISDSSLATFNSNTSGGGAVSGLMNTLVEGSDTVYYAYQHTGLGDDSVYVVTSVGSYANGVAWSRIDSAQSVDGIFNSVDYDYCSNGTVVYNRVARTLSWFDRGNGDAWRYLGSTGIPSLLSTNPQNATQMICVKDSLIIILAHLARDTSVWSYRYYATGGSRKTGITLIDSTKCLGKQYFVGSAVDSTSSMPCLMSSIDGDTVSAVLRLWMTPSNTDSIVIAASTTSGSSVGRFDSTHLANAYNVLDYGEGVRFRNMCAPRYTVHDIVVYWQKQKSSPDTIWEAFKDGLVTYGPQFAFTQMPVYDATQMIRYQFQGSSQSEDFYMNNASPTFNYGATDTLRFSNGSTTTMGAMFRPLLFETIPYPSRIVSCSLAVTVKTAGNQSTVLLHKIWKPAYEGTQVGAVPSTDSGASHTNWKLGSAWAGACASSSGGSNYTDQTLADRTTANLVSTNIGGGTSWTGFTTTGVKATWLNNVEALTHFNRAVRGCDTLSNGFRLNKGWLKISTSASASTPPVIWSSEAGTSSNAPKFVVHVFFTAPGTLKDVWMPSARKRYSSASFYKKTL